MQHPAPLRVAREIGVRALRIKGWTTIMNILITGGAGFIGANLARLAIDSGHAVRVIDDLSSGFTENLAGLDIDLVESSILDDAAMAMAAQGVDSIVHLGNR